MAKQSTEDFLVMNGLRAEKGQEPLPYTADEIMKLVNDLGKVVEKTAKAEAAGENSTILYLEGAGLYKKLRTIAERYEYMNMHFNPPKSILDEIEEFPYCDKVGLNQDA